MVPSSHSLSPSHSNDAYNRKVAQLMEQLEVAGEYTIKLSEKVKKQSKTLADLADELDCFKRYSKLCERRIGELCPSHVFPVTEKHLGTYLLANADTAGDANAQQALRLDSAEDIIHELKAAVEASQREIAEVNQRNKQLERQISASNKKGGSEKVSGRSTMNDDKSASYVKRNAELQREVDNIFKELIKERQRYNEIVSSLTQECNRLKLRQKESEEKSNVSSSPDSLLSEQKQLQTKLKSMKSDRNRLSEAVTRLETEKSALLDYVQEKECEYKNTNEYSGKGLPVTSPRSLLSVTAGASIDVDSMKIRVATLESERDSLRHAIEAAKRDCDALTREVSRQKQARSEMEAKIRQLSEAAASQSDLMNALKESRIHFRDVSFKLESTRVEKIELESKVSSLNGVVIELERELRSAKIVSEKAEHQYNALQKDLSERERRNRFDFNEMESMRTRVQQLENDKKLLHREIDEAKKTLVSKETQINSYVLSIDDKNEREKEIMADYKNVKSDISRLKSKEIAMETAVRDLEGEVHRLMEDLQRSSDKLKSAREQASIERDMMSAEVYSYKRRFEELQKLTDSNGVSTANLSSQLQTARDRCDKAEKQASDMAIKLAKTEAALDKNIATTDSSQRLIDAEKEVHLLRRQREEDIATNYAREQTRRLSELELEHRLESALSVNQVLETSVESLTEELQRRRQEQSSSNSELIDIKTVIAGLELELREKNHHIQSLHTELQKHKEAVASTDDVARSNERLTERLHMLSNDRERLMREAISRDRTLAELQNEIQFYKGERFGTLTTAGVTLPRPLVYESSLQQYENPSLTQKLSGTHRSSAEPSNDGEMTGEESVETKIRRLEALNAQLRAGREKGGGSLRELHYSPNSKRTSTHLSPKKSIPPPNSKSKKSVSPLETKENLYFSNKESAVNKANITDERAPQTRQINGSDSGLSVRPSSAGALSATETSDNLQEKLLRVQAQFAEMRKGIEGGVAADKNSRSSWMHRSQPY